jgi:hypothetical protein
MDEPFQVLPEAYAKARTGKEFSKTPCGRHGMGYVEIALENGCSVFPVEKRNDGSAVVCVPAGPFLSKSLVRRRVFHARSLKCFSGFLQGVIVNRTQSNQAFYRIF